MCFQSSNSNAPKNLCSRSSITRSKSRPIIQTQIKVPFQSDQHSNKPIQVLYKYCLTLFRPLTHQKHILKQDKLHQNLNQSLLNVFLLQLDLEVKLYIVTSKEKF
eukprot:554657_1